MVAHPDDELLGLGGTLHKICRETKSVVRVVILGEGITSRGAVRDPEKWRTELAIHRSNIKDAQVEIGYHEVSIRKFPDNRFDSVALLDIVKVVEQEKEQFKPDLIFTHHGGDTNIDHQKTFEAVITATRPIEEEGVQTIIAFETPSSTEWQAFNYKNYFQPNLFIEIEQEDLEAKIKGMESYEFEKRKFPHPRSPEALETAAKKWGTVVGKQLAEAFMIIRHIQ